MQTLRQIQIEQGEWQEANFPNTRAGDLLHGVTEELGELCHAHLKGVQGIRGNGAGKVDAIGDLVIFLIAYCNKEGIDFAGAVAYTWDQVKRRNWIANVETGEYKDTGEPSAQKQ